MLFHLLILSAALGADPVTLANQPKAQFSIEARIMDGKNLTSNPTVTVLDGEPATIEALQQRPFVTAVKAASSDRSLQIPIITVLSEGLSIRYTVTGMDDHHATIDATVEESQITDVPVRVIDRVRGTAVQAPRCESRQVRVLEPVRFGETVAIRLRKSSKRSIELVIRRQ